MNAGLVRLVDNALWFLAAAVVMALGMFLLYAALGVYGWALTKLVNQIGATGALVAFCREKRNQKTWWNRWVNWSIESWRDDGRDT